MKKTILAVTCAAVLGGCAFKFDPYRPPAPAVDVQKVAEIVAAVNALNEFAIKTGKDMKVLQDKAGIVAKK